MSRYRGPRLRIIRRLGELPGLTRKSAKRAYPPGQHGQAIGILDLSAYENYHQNCADTNYFCKRYH